MSSPASDRSALIDAVMQAAGASEASTANPVEAWATTHIAQIADRAQARLRDVQAVQAAIASADAPEESKAVMRQAVRALAMEGAKLTAEDAILEAALRIAVAAARGDVAAVKDYVVSLEPVLFTWYGLMIGGSDVTIDEMDEAGHVTKTTTTPAPAASGEET